MGLVDYSESSGSEDEAPPQPTVAKPAAAGTTAKKPFQKVVDRSNPGKIVVNLPSAKPDEPTASNDEPPAKRAQTKAAPAQSSSSSSSSRPVFQLKTGAEPGFSRDRGDGAGSSDGGGLNLPAPKAAAQPSIPQGMKPEEEVKLVGKPMMFRPLSVARKPKKKTPSSVTPTASKTEPAKAPEQASKEVSAPAPAPAPKKHSAAAAPLFETQQDESNGYADYASQMNYPLPSTAPTNSNSLDNIADDLNLSAAARRELFGRQKGGANPQTASRVINFNTDEEYKHNEELRAAGQQQIHNPVRSIAPGKHSLRQLVNQVQTQREALEESFAKGKSNRKEASSRYG
uniref:Mitotic checkpoint regulator, MAD2B-interacting-domain-containing protein n=1 Tax=Colletotrichum fructicola (strain Nara gc5) TaxID=1213859 RepID=L2G408_COLFN